jgi:HSP20 family protein
MEQDLSREQLRRQHEQRAERDEQRSADELQDLGPAFAEDEAARGDPVDDHDERKRHDVGDVVQAEKGVSLDPGQVRPERKHPCVDVNRFFGLSREGNGEREALATTDWSPSCDISETDKEYRIRAGLPNVEKDNVQVTLEEGILTIQGERPEEKEEKGVRFHRRELSYGNFLRRFTMPDNADESKVDATFNDGMLSVVIPKTEKPKQTSAKKIAVH